MALTCLPDERNKCRVFPLQLQRLALTDQSRESVIILEDRPVWCVSVNTKPHSLLIGLMFCVDIGFATNGIQDLSKDTEDIGIRFLVRPSIPTYGACLVNVPLGPTVITERPVVALNAHKRSLGL